MTQEEDVNADELCHREQIWESAKQRVRKFMAPFREYEVVRELEGGGYIPGDFARLSISNNMADQYPMVAAERRKLCRIDARHVRF